jgi:hypothetical protein
VLKPTKTACAAALLVALATTGHSQAASEPLDSAFDLALGTAGLSSATARFDENIVSFYRQSRGATQLFNSCYNDPWLTPFIVDVHRTAIRGALRQPHTLVETAGRLLGSGSRRALLGDAVEARAKGLPPTGALDAALRALREAGHLTGPWPDTAAVPQEVQQAAALIVLTALEAHPFRRAALAGAGDPSELFKALAGSPPTSDGPVAERAALARIAQIDVGYLAAAGFDMASAASRAAATAKRAPAGARFDFRVETKWGRIVLTGGRDDTHDGTPTFFVIDTSGDDTYVNNPTNSTPGVWCSVVIDCRGNDRYLSDLALAEQRIADWPDRAKSRRLLGPASARLGVSVLIDLEGNDLYRSHRPGLASAHFGVSVLSDHDGDDVYEAYADAQAFARHGAAVLEDAGGDDSYSGFTQIQGAGLEGGCAILVDRNGDDAYMADDQVIDFPSPQSAEHNISLAQGAGYGVRADFSTGKSLSGGIGILYDESGDDVYSCGVFGQGVGYWEGFGLLWDDDGHDRYVGQWYVQGASAHFGIGYLEDRGGNDSYTAHLNMAQGAGHDFGLGMLIERQGNDTYTAPNLSLGAGNANGLGVFLDAAGDDAYEARGITLGSSPEAQKLSLRERGLMLGLFIDLGGNDRYPPSAPWARNDHRTANWMARAHRPGQSQVGVFYDRAAP